MTIFLLFVFFSSTSVLLVRFNKYEDAWTEKSNTDKNKRLFPIPQTAIDGASNLPGYLKQNAGY